MFFLTFSQQTNRVFLTYAKFPPIFTEGYHRCCEHDRSDESSSLHAQRQHLVLLRVPHDRRSDRRSQLPQLAGMYSHFSPSHKSAERRPLHSAAAAAKPPILRASAVKVEPEFEIGR